MTDSHARAPRPGDAPTVDQAVHDARELSGALRARESDAAAVATQAAAAATQAAASRAPAADQPSPAGRPAVVATEIPAGGPSDPGSAAAGRSTAPSAGHGSSAATAHAATAPHGGGHGAGHEEEALGPVDIAGWAAGILGVLVALLVTVCFVLATAGAGAY